MVEVDDELVSAFIDGELSQEELKVVARLADQDANWRDRVQAFRADSEALKKQPSPDLKDSQRKLAFELAIKNLDSGVERRRVPRFRRRWMMAASFVVPVILTLAFFQNPQSTFRLYLKAEGLELQARRSIMESDFRDSRSWSSPALWGKLQAEETSSLSFQVDSEESSAQSVFSKVEYDFEGDGTVDRTEQYAAEELDIRKGWERFTPNLNESEGDYRDLEGGRIKVTLFCSTGGEIKLSGTPGELIVPYRGLRGSKGAQ